MIERITKLQKIKEISDATLHKECGLVHTSLNDWRKGKAKPSTDAIIKLAQYFNVTTDYLLGLSDNPTSCKFCT